MRAVMGYSEMAKFVVTIDGPAGSGKSTAARLLAERLGVSFLDTGAMYRAVTLAAMRASIDMNSEQQLLKVVTENEFRFDNRGGRTRVYLNGQDITDDIRQPEVTALSRYVARAPSVRAELVKMQRQLAGRMQKIVTEGRDQGTVAFPEAQVKFYLTAETNERAKRRQAELEAAGQTSDFEQVRRAIEQRDKSDQGRATGPLKPAEDAIIVDTTRMGIREVVDTLAAYVEERCSQKS